MTEGDLLTVCGRIKKELLKIERVVEEIVDNSKDIHNSPDPRYLKIVTNSIALDMHDFYNGLEKIFGEIASRIDQSAPSSGSSHKELLEQMNSDRPAARPAVLSDSTYKQLDVYRKFRHRVRHTYSFELDPEEVLVLANGVQAAFEAAMEDLNKFCSFATIAASEV